jgi:hypothetical protein
MKNLCTRQPEKHFIANKKTFDAVGVDFTWILLCFMNFDMKRKKTLLLAAEVILYAAITISILGIFKYII